MRKTQKLTRVLSMVLVLSLCLGLLATSGLKLTAKAVDNTVTFAVADFKGLGISGGKEDGSSKVSLTQGDVTVEASNGFGHADNFRVYQDAELTISTTSGNISKVEITCTASGTAKYGPGKIPTGNGYTYSGKVGTWTGSARSVTLTPSAQVRITSIVVTYTAGGNDKAVLMGASATLEGNIGLNYYVKLPASAAYVQFSVVGKNPVKMELSKGTPVTGGEYDGTYKFTYPMNAKEMHDDVTFAVYDSSDKMIDLYPKDGTTKIEAPGFVYSLADYFTGVASDSKATENLKKLAQATLQYGEYAQKAFQYNDSELDNLPAIEDAQVSATTLSGHALQKKADLPEGLTFSGMTLILETETTLCLYFNANNHNFTINGTPYTAVEDTNNPGLYCIKVSNIPAAELETVYTLAIDGTDTLTFSALSYAYAVVNDKTQKPDLQNLVKALYLYNVAANTYFDSLKTGV